MLKIKEKTLNELEGMDSSDLMIIYNLILSLKKRNAKYVEYDNPDDKLPAYLKVRTALKNCKGSMSDDILLEREDRI